MAVLSPPCPCCGTAVPFGKTQWRLGKPFICEGCNAQLVIEKNFWLPILALTVFFSGRIAMPDTASTAGLFAAICVVVLIVQRLVMKPELVTRSRP